MPQREDYEGLSLADAIRQFADHHFELVTRHISQDEYQLLQRAGQIIEQNAPDLPAYP